jgi:tripartite-type tricarboxylate transporter receptor subunit TctC
MSSVIRLQKSVIIPALLVLVQALLFAGGASAQDYPTKPINLILPQPPGGTGPILGAMLAEESKKYMKQPVVIAHKTGAGGTIGASFVAHSAPDGYTLLMARPAHTTAAPSIEKLDYTALDFEPMGQMLTSPLTLIVKADAPWKTLKEFVAFAKANPGKMTCGNSGTYSSLHFHLLRLERLAGIKLTHVPFVGGAAAVTAVAGGHVLCSARFPGEGEALIESGKVRVLSVFDNKRSHYYPNVPTSAESGFPLEAVGWGALVGPKGTPKNIVAFWEDVLRKVTSDKAFVARAEEMKMNIEFKTAEDFKKTLNTELQDFAVIVKELGLKPN